MQLKTINERLPGLANEAAAIELDPNRSPSPPPRYDSNGKRTNTREMRMREILTKERNSLIERLLKINPNYQPPADYVRQKPMRKMYIPVKEYPNYNFIGLVIGPRGNPNPNPHHIPIPNPNRTFHAPTSTLPLPLI